jgi:Sensors of blue-light using FAD
MDTSHPNPDSGQVFRLIYRSRNRIASERRKTELGGLFSVARAKNKRLGITGALLISSNWFAQALEGDEDAVRALFATIERDGRHERISVLEDQTVPGRVFARWAMARVSADGEPDIRLIATTGGIIPAADQGATPEQESILDIMRQATGSDAHAT